MYESMRIVMTQTEKYRTKHSQEMPRMTQEFRIRKINNVKLIQA